MGRTPDFAVIALPYGRQHGEGLHRTHTPPVDLGDAVQPGTVDRGRRHVGAERDNPGDSVLLALAPDRTAGTRPVVGGTRPMVGMASGRGRSAGVDRLRPDHRSDRFRSGMSGVGLGADRQFHATKDRRRGSCKYVGESRPSSSEVARRDYRLDITCNASGCRSSSSTPQERVGGAWRSRWDSLRLFTPARYDGLDGKPFPAPSHTFPSKDEMADYLEAYSTEFALPVRSGAEGDEPVEQEAQPSSWRPTTAGSRLTTWS